MTAPDPPAVAGTPAEAVLAARLRPLIDEHLDMYEPIIRAHERAQVLAEVDAALRDVERVKDWLGRGEMDRRAIGFPAAADYLRDTLAPDAREAT